MVNLEISSDVPPDESKKAPLASQSFLKADELPSDSEDPDYDHFDIDKVRKHLNENREMAVGHLIMAALEHACDGITNTDLKVIYFCRVLRSREAWSYSGQILERLAWDVISWLRTNWIKSIFMFIGLGGFFAMSATHKGRMKLYAHDFIAWCLSASMGPRFLAFVVLMMVRLIVSTVVPPTSPAFGIILQAATPDSEKWTAIPFFLAASTVAGAAPYVLDKFIQCFVRRDFMYTFFMKRFADLWPLTCWTGPTMMQVFHGAGGGKMGASLAVIVAHAAPFMGAQTTNMQRYFLPHPLDTILSQPFGMSEDLLSIALAEAMTNPIIGSVSLTALIIACNFGRYLTMGRMDYKAISCFFCNFVVGGIAVKLVLKLQGSEFSAKILLVCVAVQMAIQLMLIPLIVGCCVSPWNRHMGL